MTFYDPETGKLLHQVKAPMHVHAFALSEDYTRLYTVGHGKVAVWEFGTEVRDSEESRTSFESDSVAGRTDGPRPASFTYRQREQRHERLAAH